MEEHKIGDTFDYKGITLMVVPDPLEGCAGCYFEYKGECSNTCCLPSERSDETGIMYKEIIPMVIKPLPINTLRDIYEELKTAVMSGYYSDRMKALSLLDKFIEDHKNG